jgi:hypothetical protein
MNETTLELTPLEKREISKLKFSKIKDTIGQAVVPIRVTDLYEEEFVRNFISSRNLNWKVLSACVFCFGTVGMHVDGLEKYSGDSRTLVIFLDGKGDFGYIREDGTVAHALLSKGSIVLFNDAKPHDFINKGKTLCRAIIAELRIENHT